MSAISGAYSGVPMMEDRELHYQVSMAMAREMLGRGIIDEKAYEEFDARMREKYKQIVGALFTNLSLFNRKKQS